MGGISFLGSEWSVTKVSPIRFSGRPWSVSGKLGERVAGFYESDSYLVLVLYRASQEALAHQDVMALQARG